MQNRLNHVAIAVPDIEAASESYRCMLGAKVTEPEDQPEHGVTVVFVELENTKIELIAPFGNNSPIAGFLKKYPTGGIHHICLEVPDIAAAMDAVVDQGKRPLGDEPKIGAHGKPVFFVHPKDFDGVLVEFEEA